MATLLDCISTDSLQTAIIIPHATTPIVLSHNALLSKVLAFQAQLADLGISPTSVVSLAFPNTIEFIIAFFAVTLQRATSSPLNPAYKEEEFKFYLEDLKSVLLLVPSEDSKQKDEAVRAAQACGTGIAEVRYDGEKIVVHVVESGRLAGRKPAQLEKPQSDDVALILHTSGTTGRPKAVPLTHQQLRQTTMNIESTYALTNTDRTMIVMPLFHIHGIAAGLLTPLVTGGSVVVPPRFSAKDFWGHFIAYNANWYTAVPTVHQIMLKQPLPSPMPYIRFIRSCSSPLSPTAFAELETKFGAPVLEAYAMTEASHQMTSNPLPPATRKPGSVGIPQNVDLRILDNAGLPFPRGSIGEICVKGQNVTSGYLGDAASPFTQDGYLRTGDQGYQDSDGYVFLTGRIKELINKGGEKISPIELDNTFSQHPMIAEAVSFAMDDVFYGQEVALAVVLQPEAALTAPELSAWFAQRAAKFKVPKRIFFTNTMPKTATGKVQRRLVAKAMIDEEKRAELEVQKKLELKTAGVEATGRKSDGPSRIFLLVASLGAAYIFRQVVFWK